MLLWHGSERGDRKPIHMNEPPEGGINEPFTSRGIRSKKSHSIRSLNNSLICIHQKASVHRPDIHDQTLLCTLNRVFVSTSVHCRSASTTPSGSPCSSQQSVYHAGGADAPAAPAAPDTQPSWNPFGDDNFSKLTAEELLNKDFAKLAEGKCNVIAVQ